MSVCFNAINIHGLLVLFSAFVKISHGFVGDQLLFLLRAHLLWGIRSPRSLSKLVSHALDSEVPCNLFTGSFLKCWKMTAHLLQFSVIILLKECPLLSFLILWLVSTPSRGFPWAFFDCCSPGAAMVLLMPLLCLWQPAENRLLWTQLNWKMYKRSTLAIVHRELFLTIKF